jgi:hypothetical protein
LLIHDETQNETSISVDYAQRTHNISITGTTVVPEFPLPLLIAVSSMAAIILAARLGLTRHKIK